MLWRNYSANEGKVHFNNNTNKGKLLPKWKQKAEIVTKMGVASHLTKQNELKKLFLAKKKEKKLFLASRKHNRSKTSLCNSLAHKSSLKGSYFDQPSLNSSNNSHLKTKWRKGKQVKYMVLSQKIRHLLESFTNILVKCNLK